MINPKRLFLNHWLLMLALPAVLLCGLFMAFAAYTANQEAHQRIERNFAKKFYRYIDDQLGDSPDLLSGIDEGKVLPASDVFFKDHQTSRQELKYIAKYVVIAEKDRFIVFHGTGEDAVRTWAAVKKNPGLQETINPTYDPTNGIHSAGDLFKIYGRKSGILPGSVHK